MYTCVCVVAISLNIQFRFSPLLLRASSCSKMVCLTGLEFPMASGCTQNNVPYHGQDNRIWFLLPLLFPHSLPCSIHKAFFHFLRNHESPPILQRLQLSVPLPGMFYPVTVTTYVAHLHNQETQFLILSLIESLSEQFIQSPGSTMISGCCVFTTCSPLGVLIAVSPTWNESYKKAKAFYVFIEADLQHLQQRFLTESSGSTKITDSIHDSLTFPQEHSFLHFDRSLLDASKSFIANEAQLSSIE